MADPEHAGLRAPDEPVLIKIFAAYTVCATAWLLLATFVGVILALKFYYPDLLTAPAFSFGRARQYVPNGTFYAWASPALIGLPALFIAARRLPGTQLQPAPRLDRPGVDQSRRDLRHRGTRSRLQCRRSGIS